MQAFLRLILLCGSLFFCIGNTKAQTACTWQQGDMLTYSQSNWGDELSEAGILLESNFNNLYPGDLQVGLTNLLRFQYASAVFSYMPAIGTANVLTATIIDPINTPAGELGGEVTALKLNIDFSDSKVLGGNAPLGDLIFHDVTSLPIINGQSIRQILTTANYILGGGSNPPYSPSTAAALARSINSAFLNGTPSQFALDHLKRGWQQGDFITYTQANLDVFPDPQLIFTQPNYNTVYGSNGGVVEIGIAGASGFSMQFTGIDGGVRGYLVTAGSPSSLTADLINPTSSPSGTFGGDVLVLTLTIDFSDAGLMNGNANIPYGDLVLTNFQNNLSSLNGLTVRQFNSLANILLGGGSNGYTISDIATITAQLTAAFSDAPAPPTQFAQDHLLNPNCNPCPTSTNWQQGDMFTRSQLVWNGDATWYINYNSVYAANTGIVEVGIHGDAGYSLQFAAGNEVNAFFIQSGTPAALNADLFSTTGSSSGMFGGEVLALRLNIDFADAGFLSGNSSVPFGNLVLHELASYNAAPLPELDGLSVREVIAIANFMLGGGSSTFEFSSINNLVAVLNASFIDGTPSSFAQDHLALPCNITPPNHCPVTISSSVITPLGTSINVQLQASDEDNDALTYSISQNPLHGTVTTSSTGAASYTPTAGYYGADEFKFKASDGKCDGEGTVTITIVVCPKKKGDWKNNPDSWPASATPMMLGTQSYTKQQLITILNTPVGTGNKADASLILAHQLIASKLSITNGSPSAPIAATITHADGLLSAYSGKLPYKVKPNTAAGQAMTADALVLENYNNGLMTTGCSATPALTRASTTAMSETSIDESIGWQVKLFPNPSANSFSITVHADAKEKIMMQVIDMYGRVVETRNANANSTIRFGDRYNPGTYFVRIMQGKEHKEMKLIKLFQ